MDIYLPIAEMPINVFVLMGIGIVVGFISGLFGIGGGFLMTPLLTFLGVPAAIAVASQANQQVGTSLSGALAHWRKKNIDFQMAFILMIGSLIGTGIGVQIFKWLKQIGQINLFIALSYVSLLSVVGLLMLWETAPRLFKKEERVRAAPRIPQPALDSQKGITVGWGAGTNLAMDFPASNLRVSMLLPLFMGVMAGMLVSMLGVGGFVMVPAMIYILKMPPRLVNGTSLVQIIFTSMAATVMQSVSNHTVDLLLAVLLLSGSVIGVPFGARLSSHLRSEVARFLMALLILGVGGMLLKNLMFTPDTLFSIDVTVL
ncbi:MAG TPA: permease [Rhodospirillaceae bacterium]|nr:permease [Rhodospirillaceae bacterium]